MKIKVAIVGPPLGFLFGGQEVQAQALFGHWRNDPEVSAIFISSRPDFPAALAWLGRIPLLRTMMRLPLYVAKLFRALGKVEVVHIFAGSFGTFLIATTPAFLAARLRGKRVLIHYHSGRGKEHVERSALARYVLWTSDVVVLPSEYLVPSFREHGIASVVVANVVDLDRFPYRPRDPLRPKLLCTRNFEVWCGNDIVIQAFARVQREFPEASLRMVGTGEQELALRRLAAELALNHVEFLGAIHPDAMPAMYAQSDLFINGSYIDYAPVSIVEGFCSGLPILSTTGGGGISLLVEHEHTGLLCDPGDWETLAQNTIRLLRHPDLARSLAKKANEQASLYSWPKLRELWLRTYQGMVEL